MKDWTIMVYMAADNNLNVEMVYALEQLKEVARQNKEINLYVYYDGLSSDVPTLYCDFSQQNCKEGDADCPINFYQSYKIDKLIDVDDSFNENSAAVNNIINFVDWCVKRENDPPEIIKEKKYAFIFSGHSFGFLNWGLFKDDKADYFMTHRKLKYMFERITSTKGELLIKAEADEDRHRRTHGTRWSNQTRKERTTVILGKPLDILGFDSCVMSTIELGSQFRKFAKTMVASEGSIPTAGWNYAQILLGRIGRFPKSSAKQIAISFVDEFIKQQNKFALADISVDISAWDLTCLPTLEDNFAELVDNLLDCFIYGKPFVYNQMKRLLIYAHWQCQTYMFEQHIDLGDFCQILFQEIDSLKEEIDNGDFSLLFNISESCKKVIESIQNCILLTGFSGSDFQFSSGISLFFPWSLASYESAREDYEKLTFITKNYAGNIWNEFLQIYLGYVTFRESIPLTEFDENGNVKYPTIIYESYANMDNSINGTDGRQPPNTGRQPPNTGRQPPNTGRQPPNTGRQPPNTGRQPPNTGRQPPNTGRMIGDMNIFLSRFMRLKNFQSNWNRTGFTSKNVIFRPASALDRPGGVQPKPDELMIIDIPRPRTISKQIIELMDNLSKVGKEYSAEVNMDEYIKILEVLFSYADEPTTIQMLADFNESNLFKEGIDKNITELLGNVFLKSIMYIHDEEIKDRIYKNFENVHFK